MKGSPTGLEGGQRLEIRIAGLGGQGVVTIGRILGLAFSVHEGLNSVNTQSYGPESRGGACRSEVVVSAGEIYYPYVRRADLLVVLTQVALEAYLDDLRPGGALLADRDGVLEIPPRPQGRVLWLPFMETAHRLGGVRFQNVVALGAIQGLLGDRLGEGSLKEALAQVLPGEYLEVNLAAFEAGRRLVSIPGPERGEVGGP